MTTSRWSWIFAALLLGGTGASADQSDATSPQTIACAQERDDPMGDCGYDIKRDETGKTTVTVIFGNGFKRKLFFQDETFVKASMTMSGVGTDTDWSVQDGMHLIRGDGQRYEVPDILISGD